MSAKTAAALLGLFLIIPDLLAQGGGAMGGRSQITGLVRYSGRNTPAENVLVRLEAYTGGNVGDVQTDRSGKFVFTGLAGQEYDLTIEVPGYLPATQHIDLQTVLTAFVQIQLLPDKRGSVSDSKPGASTVDARIPGSARKEFDKARATLDNPKKIQETISHLEKAVSLAPNFEEAQLLLGTVYMDAQQWDKAAVHLQQVAEAKPDSASPLLALGEVYLRTQKYKDAEDAFGRALHLDDNSFQAHLGLGRACYAAGDLAKAGAEVDRAIQLNPDYAEGDLLAGNIRFKSRQADKALPFFERYLQLRPNGAYAAQTRDLVSKIKKALGLPQP